MGYQLAMGVGVPGAGYTIKSFIDSCNIWYRTYSKFNN